MQAENCGTVQSTAGISSYFYLFRLLHWVLTIAFVFLLLTGLSLHAIARPDRSLFSGVLPDYVWSGRVHLWHFATALVFCPSLLAVIFVCRRRVWSRPLYAIMLGGGLVMIVTGLLMVNAVASGEAGKLVVWLHSSLALLLLPFALLWHFVTGFTRRIRLLRDPNRRAVSCRRQHGAVADPGIGLSKSRNLPELTIEENRDHATDNSNCSHAFLSPVTACHHGMPG